MEPQITIQIVGWNSAKPLRSGVDILAAMPRDQVIIRYIDNASTDDSIATVRKHLPLTEIIANKENIGFAAAHNLGFTKCTTPYVLTHDPDVRLKWDSIQQLLEAFNDPKVAAVQGKLTRAETHNVIDSAGIILTLALNGKERGAGEIDTGQYDKPAELTAVTGACGLYRMEALQSVAHEDNVKNPLEVFDSDFFAYKEDVDLGWRLKNAGWKSLYLPIVMGTHARTLGARGFMNWGMNPKKIYDRLRSPRTRYSLRNYIWMLVKNITWKQEFVHETFILVRFGSFFLLSILYPPLLGVWLEALQGIPNMIRKRVNPKLNT